MNPQLSPLADNEIYAAFLASKDSEETKGSYARNLVTARRFLGKEVYEATEDELIAFFVDCRKRGLKVSTLQTYKCTLSTFFKHLKAKKKIKDNPMEIVCEEIKTKNRDKTIRKALTIQEREKVYKSLNWEGGLHEYQISLAILFGCKMGLRRFEIAKVQWEDLDLEAGTMTVLGKGNKKVDGLPMSQTLIDKLKDYKILVDKAGIDSRWVFHKPGHEIHHMSKESVYEWYQLIKKRCGFPADFHFGVHQGRRVFCTSLHEAKIDTLTAIKLSRHEDGKTFQGYVRIDQDKVSDALHKAID